MAARQGVRSADLLAIGALDGIIGEYPDAGSEPARFSARVAAAIRHELASLTPSTSPAGFGDARSGSNGWRRRARYHWSLRAPEELQRRGTP